MTVLLAALLSGYQPPAPPKVPPVRDMLPATTTLLWLPLADRWESDEPDNRVRRAVSASEETGAILTRLETRLEVAPPAPRLLSYADAYEIAAREQRPIVVFAGVPRTLAMRYAAEPQWRGYVIAWESTSVQFGQGANEFGPPNIKPTPSDVGRRISTGRWVDRVGSGGRILGRFHCGPGG